MASIPTSTAATSEWIATGNFPEWDLGVQVMPDTEGPDVRGDRPARPDQAGSRGALPGPGRRAPNPRPEPGQLLRRDRAGRVPPGPPGPRDRHHRRPAAARPDVLLPRHPAHAPRWAELPQIPINRPVAPVNDNSATASASRRSTRASPRTPRTRWAAAARSRRSGRATRTSPVRWTAEGEDPRRRASTTTSARRPCSTGR